MISVVAVEGLDGFGKTWFAKRLTESLNENAQDGVRFIYQHFPVYENETGKQIKEILFNRVKGFTKLSDIKQMIELQMRNRMEWWIDSYEELNSPAYKQTIVIADRFTASNAIYQYSCLQNMDEAIDYYRDMEYNRFHTIIPALNIFTTCDKELQEKRLKKRDNLDTYETLEHQDFLRSKYEEVARKFTNNYRKEFWIALDLLDGEYVQQHYFPQWKPEAIAEEMYKITVYYIARRFNETYVLKKGNKFKMKDFKTTWMIYSWFINHITRRTNLYR